MILFKRREFGDVFSDTFQFFRDHTKHYLVNFLTINGIPILLLLLINYFFTSYTYDMSVLANPQDFNTYSYEGGPTILTSFLIAILGIAVALLQYTFSPIYFLLYQKHGGENFGAQEIFDAIFKKYLGKIIIFFLAIILVSIPVAILAGIASLILLLTLVGFIMPFVVVNQWYSMAFIEYLSSEKGVFTAIGDMFSAVFVKFWHHTGALFLISFLVIIVVYAMMIAVFMSAGFGSAGFIGGGIDPEALTLISVVSMVLNQVLGILMQYVTQTANMIVYFSIKEEQENISGLDEIESIGESE